MLNLLTSATCHSSPEIKHGYHHTHLVQGSSKAPGFSLVPVEDPRFLPGQCEDSKGGEGGGPCGFLHIVLWLERSPFAVSVSPYVLGEVGRVSFVNSV